MNTKDIKIKLPAMLSSEGVPFEVKETEENGVFDTWSGDDRNYGCGNTTYIAYTYSPDGRNVYYSDARTGYKLTLPEGGEYQLYVYGEKEYVTPREKRIEGFSEKMLILPEGAFGWCDDGCGVMTAVFDKYAPVKYIMGGENPNLEKGECIYYAACGTKVREISVKAVVSGGRKETTVGVIADAHINYLSDADKDDAELVFTNQTRLWARGGAFIERTLKAADFAHVYDGVVLAGDICDFLTVGSASILKEQILDKYENIYFTAGGHDLTKNMETGLGDKKPAAERQELLQSYCKNDIIYFSKLLNDNVLCILLCNNISYYPGQAQKLKADVKTAREKGYTVLIFQHEPVATEYPLYSETHCMDECHDPVKTVFNYCGTKSLFGAGRSESEHTLAVRDVILNNADVIRGVFCGHRHYNYYTELKAYTPDGKECPIPQYVVRACAYEPDGCVTKITVK